MQALGFAYALLPLADGREREEEAAFIRRHLGYVNTSPAFSGALLGMVAREEERLMAQGATAAEAAVRVTAVKRQLEGPLAALGDRTFWGWLRPLAGVAGAYLLMMEPGIVGQAGPIADAAGNRAAMASVLLVLGFYNGPYLAIRWLGTRRGLTGRGGAAAAPGAAGVPLGASDFLGGRSGPLGVTRLNALFEILGPILVGAVAGRLIDLARIEAAPRGLGIGIALVLAGICLGAGARRWGQPPERVALVLLAFLLFAGGGIG
jgi:hypothetical protein